MPRATLHLVGQFLPDDQYSILDIGEITTPISSIKSLRDPVAGKATRERLANEINTIWFDLLRKYPNSQPTYRKAYLVLKVGKTLVWWDDFDHPICSGGGRAREHWLGVDMRGVCSDKQFRAKVESLFQKVG